jgi:histidine phosphotransferase ChpT
LLSLTANKDPKGDQNQSKFMDNDIALAGLLCSRLCHDLISPVGAFNNGLEILSDEGDPDMRAEVIGLLSQSAGQTASRLKYFRLAFGLGSGFGALLPADEVKSLVNDYFAGGKIVLDWQSSATQFPKDTAKVMLNLMLLAGDVLPAGGGITIETRHAASQLDMTITAQGKRLLVADGLSHVLSGAATPQDLDSKLIPAYLAARLAPGQVGMTTDGDRAVVFFVREGEQNPA